MRTPSLFCSTVVSRIAHEACISAPVSNLQIPWWENLDPDFYSSPESFELEIRDRALVKACAALDTCIRTAGALTLGGLAVPVGYHPLRLYRDLGDEKTYTLAAEARDPSLFFTPPQRNVTINSRKPRTPYFDPEDGLCEDLFFESPFRPVNPRFAKAFKPHANNQTAHARYWRHDRGPRPTVIAVHGFYADAYWLNERMFEIRGFYSLGCDVLLFTLPFHGRRQSRFSPFSGYGFFSGGVAGINESFAQTVHDLRVFMDYLEDVQGVESIGFTGISLGGYTSALMTCVDERVRFAIPNVPVASIPDLLMEWDPVNILMKALLRTSKVTLAETRRLMAVHCPLTYTPLLPKSRLMVIGGIGDRLAPPKHSRLLWEHWGRCRLHWFPGSHVLHLDKGEYVFEIERFLRDIEFLL